MSKEIHDPFNTSKELVDATLAAAEYQVNHKSFTLEVLYKKWYTNIHSLSEEVINQKTNDEIQENALSNG